MSHSSISRTLYIGFKAFNCGDVGCSLLFLLLFSKAYSMHTHTEHIKGSKCHSNNKVKQKLNTFIHSGWKASLIQLSVQTTQFWCFFSFSLSIRWCYCCCCCMDQKLYSVVANCTNGNYCSSLLMLLCTTRTHMHIHKHIHKRRNNFWWGKTGNHVEYTLYWWHNLLNKMLNRKLYLVITFLNMFSKWQRQCQPDTHIHTQVTNLIFE